MVSRSLEFELTGTAVAQPIKTQAEGNQKKAGARTTTRHKRGVCVCVSVETPRSETVQVHPVNLSRRG